MNQPERIGDPLTVTVNLCAPVANGAFDLDVRLVRATRSTSTGWWSSRRVAARSRPSRPRCSRAPPVVDASAARLSRRAAFEEVAVHPDAASPTGCGSIKFRFVEGLPRYGTTPLDVPANTFSKMWLSDAVPRRVDFLSLLSFSDTFFARIFHARGTIVPIGTVSMTTAFHATRPTWPRKTPRTCSRGRRQIFHKSFGDQTGELWAPSGRLLATTTRRSSTSRRSASHPDASLRAKKERPFGRSSHSGNGRRITPPRAWPRARQRGPRRRRASRIWRSSSGTSPPGCARSCRTRPCPSRS